MSMFQLPQILRQLPATLGQLLMAQSLSVTVASDQTDIPVSGTVDIGTMPEVEIKNDSGNPVPVSGTVTVTDGSGPLTVDGTVSVGNGAGASAVNIQDGGNSITVDGTVTANPSGNTSSAVTPAAMSTVVATVLASNANRKGATIHNAGSASVLVKLGAAASTTSYTVSIANNGYYEVPFNYTGIITGITSAGTATVYVTEITA